MQRTLRAVARGHQRQGQAKRSEANENASQSGQEEREKSSQNLESARTNRRSEVSNAALRRAKSPVLQRQISEALWWEI